MFSVNRLEYLIPTLESTDKFIDWGDHEVDGIFIDDMPTDRDDEKVFNLAYKYGYNNIVLHEENQGAAGTWRASYELLKDKGYDFVFMQEDDIIINQPIKIDNMIEYLNENESCYQVHLSRQTDWYYEDQKDLHKRDGVELTKWKNFYTVPHLSSTFSGSFSLTKGSHHTKAINMWQDKKMPKEICNDSYIFAEGFICKVFNHYGKLNKNNKPWGITFYDENKNQITEHVGEWTWGHRVPIEYLNNTTGTGWYQERLKEQINDPTTKINSRSWEKL